VVTIGALSTVVLTLVLSQVETTWVHSWVALTLVLLQALKTGYLLVGDSLWIDGVITINLFRL
jgi:hypothetical protein